MRLDNTELETYIVLGHVSSAIHFSFVHDLDLYVYFAESSTESALQRDKQYHTGYQYGIIDQRTTSFLSSSYFRASISALAEGRST